MLNRLKKGKNFFNILKNTTPVTIFFGTLLLVGSISFFSIAMHYYLLTRELNVPKISQPDNITNDVITFTSEDRFAAKINNNKIISDRIADNLYKIELPQKNGIYDYELFGYNKSKLFSVYSRNSISGQVEADYEEPVIQNLELAPMYNEENITISFDANEAAQTVINNEEKNCTASDETVAEENITYTCEIKFETEGENELNFAFVDNAGNTSKENLNTIFTPLPELACSQVPEITNQTSISIECTTNKEGLLFINGQEYNPNAGQASSYEINLIEESENNIELKFIDTYELENTQNLKIIRDTTGPTSEFTFLDSKKQFQTGSIGIGFKSSEKANVKVSFFPINNFFETDELAKQILDSGNFVYEGGQNFEQAVEAGEEVNFTTPNNFALCQILTATNKNCFSPGVVGIEINLTDVLGNSRNYLCNNWLTTSTAQLDGLDATTCQEK